MNLNRDDVFYGTQPIVSIPKQSINLAPIATIMGVQVNHTQAAQQPVTLPAVPVNVQRIKNTLQGTFSYYVQSFRAGTASIASAQTGSTIYLQNQNGTQIMTSTGGAGPTKFTTAAVAGAGSITVQTTTVNGPSLLGFGFTNTRALVQA